MISTPDNLTRSQVYRALLELAACLIGGMAFGFILFYSWFTIS